MAEARSDQALREAWRDGYDTALRMVDAAARRASASLASDVEAGGRAMAGLALSMEHVRDEAEQQAEARGIFDGQGQKGEADRG